MNERHFELTTFPGSSDTWTLLVEKRGDQLWMHREYWHEPDGDWLCDKGWVHPQDEPRMMAALVEIAVIALSLNQF
jgi:hypothetical protein